MIWILLADTVLLLAALYLTRPVYAAFRKRRSGYGIVFNTFTELPEALVSVRLRDLHGQIVRSAVTDRHGKYRLAAPPGDYLVEVAKAGFVFPSAYITKEINASVYDNILPATHIVVKDHGVITKNIPIDPEQGATRRRRRRKIVLGKHTQYLIAILTPLLVLASAVYFTTSWILWTLFGLYVLVMLRRAFTFKPAEPPFGTIRDHETNEPVTRAIVRIFEAKFNKLLETQVTSAKGRYAFIVHPGRYYVVIKKEGYKTVRVNFPPVKRDGTLLVKDVKLTRLAATEYEEVTSLTAADKKVLEEQGGFTLE